MARNKSKKENKTPEVEVPELDDLPGGSAGTVEDIAQTNRLPINPTREDFERSAQPKMYRVIHGGSVMYNGCRTPVRNGKIYQDNTVDLDMLRKQGIILEEIIPPSPEPSEVVEPESEVLGKETDENEPA